MARVLILYGTGEGHTRKIATRMAEVVENKGHELKLVQGNKAPANLSLDGFDAAIIGTSIHMGLHQISVRKLVRRLQEAFNKIPIAYFVVCLTAISSRTEDQEQVQKYIEDFKKYTGVEPGRTTAFAGALRYPYYNFIKRFIMKLIARKLGADTDTSQEHEYTDWDAVENYAGDFVDSLSTNEIPN